MKKLFIIDVILLAIIVLAFTCFGLIYEQCTSYWKILSTGDEFTVQIYKTLAYKTTAEMTLCGVIALLCIVVAVFVNLKDLGVMKASFIETVRNKKSQKQANAEQKAIQQKQAKIAELEAELAALKKDDLPPSQS